MRKSAGPITPHSLARLLEPFEIRPRNLRSEGSVVKGYKRELFRDAWERYVPSMAGTAVDTATPLRPHKESENGDPVKLAAISAVGANSLFDAPSRRCSVVADA